MENEILAQTKRRKPKDLIIDNGSFCPKFDFHIIEYPYRKGFSARVLLTSLRHLTENGGGWNRSERAAGITVNIENKEDAMLSVKELESIAKWASDAAKFLKSRGEE